MFLLFFLTIPAIFAFLASKSNKYIFKAMQTLSCLIIAFSAGLYYGVHNFWYLPAAFLASVTGDYFLSFKHKGENYFIYGIALYFLAHIGYLLYIVMSFEINFIVLAAAFAVLLAGYLIYFFVSLKKSVSGVMGFAVLAYLIISCAVLALAAAASAALPVRLLVIAGIALIVLSDTVIAESDFMGRKRLSFLILPTYYAAQIILCASLIIKTFI